MKAIGRRPTPVLMDDETPDFVRFTILPTINGFEVIDRDGRPVDRRDTKRQASGVAYKLNRAAADSTLAGALGAR